MIGDCELDQKALFCALKELLGKRREQVYPSGSRNQELCEQLSDYFVTRISATRKCLDANPEVIDEERDDQESSTSVLLGFDVLK